VKSGSFEKKKNDNILKADYSIHSSSGTPEFIPKIIPIWGVRTTLASKSGFVQRARNF
jgi:hypothetical protein